MFGITLTKDKLFQPTVLLALALMGVIIMMVLRMWEPLAVTIIAEMLVSLTVLVVSTNSVFCLDDETPISFVHNTLEKILFFVLLNELRLS